MRSREAFAAFRVEARCSTMSKSLPKEQAELFAKGWQKGYETGKAHGEKLEANAERRREYSRNRVAQLAKWRRFAIERLGIGPKVVAEIDRESKRGLTR